MHIYNTIIKCTNLIDLHVGLLEPSRRFQLRATLN